MVLISILEVSYNRPKFSACATWAPNAISLANVSTFGSTSTGLFVTKNNTVYATGLGISSVLVWAEGSATITQTIFTDLNASFRVFVTNNGDVYADNGNSNYRVGKWAKNATNSTIAMYVSGRCTGLFVDVYDSLYCSLWNSHRVLKRSAGNDANTSITVAGNGAIGSAANMLSSPCGIFVDTDLTLYVADYNNSRIQQVRSGQLNGSTVAGTSAPGTITLNGPANVILDADGYLFIVDQENSRIVGSGPNGFRCIVGCSGTTGLGANQFQRPYDLSFDTHGNLYVTDASNNRLQKFMLARNSCGELLDTFSVGTCKFSYVINQPSFEDECK